MSLHLFIHLLLWSIFVISGLVFLVISVLDYFASVIFCFKSVSRGCNAKCPVQYQCSVAACMVVLILLSLSKLLLQILELSDLFLASV